MTKKDDEISALITLGVPREIAFNMNRHARRAKLAELDAKPGPTSIVVKGKRWGYNMDVPNAIIKEIPDSLLALRTELPMHPDIYEYAIKGLNFEDCCARIAEKLDIVVDGVYDGDKLCAVLVEALRKRRFHGLAPHLRVPGLVAAEIVETAKGVSLERVTTEVGVIASSAEALQESGQKESQEPSDHPSSTEAADSLDLASGDKTDSQQKH